MEIRALPSWVKAEAGNLYVVKLCMDKKKKKTQKSGILGIITAHGATIYITVNGLLQGDSSIGWEFRSSRNAEVQ